MRYSKRRNNISEGKLWDLLALKGYRFTQKDWPDFAILDENDDFLAVVEVKKDKSVTENQNQYVILQAFANLKIPAYIWSPKEGFKQIQPKPIITTINPKYLGQKHENVHQNSSFRLTVPGGS
jgi:hypothetical protein